MKIVSVSGAAMVAAGIVKAGADIVWMAGHSGGTGASPLDTIKYGGLPWSMGCRCPTWCWPERPARAGETGGRWRHSDGLHAVKMFLLGADAVGWGRLSWRPSAAYSSVFCHLGVYGRRRHAAQGPDAKYQGKPIYGLKFLLFFAREVRESLAMGYRSVREIIGRTDLLRERQDLRHDGTDPLRRSVAHATGLWATDLSPFPHQPTEPTSPARCRPSPRGVQPEAGGGVLRDLQHRSRLRCYLAGELALRKEREGQRFPIKIHLRGMPAMGSALAFTAACRFSWTGLPTMRWATRWRRAG